MSIYDGLMGPKSENYDFHWFYKCLWRGQNNHEQIQRTHASKRAGQFLVILWSLWQVIFDDFGITVKAMWGHFGYMKIDFEKRLCPLIECKTVVKPSGDIGIILG